MDVFLFSFCYMTKRWSLGIRGELKRYNISVGYCGEIVQRHFLNIQSHVLNTGEHCLLSKTVCRIQFCDTKNIILKPNVTFSTQLFSDASNKLHKIWTLKDEVKEPERNRIRFGSKRKMKVQGLALSFLLKVCKWAHLFDHSKVSLSAAHTLWVLQDVL